MPILPCPLCGYHTESPDCPHCGMRPAERSLGPPTRGPWSGLLPGLVAVPRGLWFLGKTRGVKRWLVPPLIGTTAVLIALLVWTFGELNELIDSVLPGEFAFEDGTPGWIEGSWGWVEATWGALIVATEWLINALWGMLTSKPLQLLGWFFVGSLVMWYCFSIVYEALAGPFLDEVQSRFEAKWFGSDPRSRLERPNDLPPDRAANLLTIASVVGAAVFLGLLWLPGVPWWVAVLATPAGFAPAWLLDRRFGPWIAWIAKVESRAAWASLQASIITGILILFAVPLYFVPWVGYFLFAGVTGFATAIGLLDIPFERRGWSLGMRWRFIRRNLLPLIAFGIVSGALLAVPLLGPVMMVPSASIGGLWLVCRLDKGPFRREGERERKPDRPPADRA